MRRLVIAAAASLAGGTPGAAFAQWSGATYGAYNATPPSLNSGAFSALQLDQSGNLKVDCILGCSSSSAGGTAAAQGTPAAIASAWPFYPVQGGAAVSTANPLFVQDPFDGAPITATTMPAGGSGIIGWLSAMYKLQAGTLTVGGTVSIAGPISISGTVAVTDATLATALANPLKTVPVGITGAPTVAAGAIAASTAILAAEPANTPRLHFTVANFAAAGGASLYCTDDGSTPTPTSASFIVYAQGFYERDTPAWVPSASIACVPSSGSVNYRAESYP